MKKLVLVLGDDWEGLYVDGALATQGHRVTLAEMAAALSV